MISPTGVWLPRARRWVGGVALSFYKFTVLPSTRILCGRTHTSRFGAVIKNSLKLLLKLHDWARDYRGCQMSPNFTQCQVDNHHLLLGSNCPGGFLRTSLEIGATHRTAVPPAARMTQHNNNKKLDYYLHTTLSLMNILCYIALHYSNWCLDRSLNRVTAATDFAHKTHPPSAATLRPFLVCNSPIFPQG